MQDKGAVPGDGTQLVTLAGKQLAGDPQRIVVVGGGIVGLMTAYYLTQRGLKVALLEKCAVACHSSGKGGGFLTDGDSGWHAGSMARLAKHSFALHEELAKEFGAEAIGYRRVRCVGRGRGGADTPSWLKPGVYKKDLGDETGMAQVTPYKLMDVLAAAVTSKGGDIVIGKAMGVNVEGRNVTSVRVEQDGKEIALPCAGVVLGMGAWASEAAPWFPDSAFPRDTVSNRYTSVVWDDTEVGKSATMVFTMDKHDTEIYPRSNECYANGCPTVAELPDNPLDIVPPPGQVEGVKADAVAAVDRLRDAPVTRATACFLAGSDDGLPVIGPVPGTSNAVVACGGGCWGILNGPAMGQAAAALVAGDKPAVDIGPFAATRFARRR